MITSENLYDTEIYRYFGKKLRRQAAIGDFGVEIEVEGSNLVSGYDPNMFEYWSIHNEGSLRNGMEYVNNGPAPLEVRPKMWDEYRKFTSKAIFAKDSIRTSVHVHINVATLTVRQVFNVIVAYYLLENILVHVNGPSRIGNLHCLRLVDAEGIIQQLIEEVKSGSPLGHWSEDNRYAALNLSSLRKFGSLEFRFIKGETDPRLIDMWIETLRTLVLVAANHTSPDAVLLSYHSTPSAREFIRKFSTPQFMEFLTERMPKGIPWRTYCDPNTVPMGDLVSTLKYNEKRKIKPSIRRKEHEDIDPAEKQSNNNSLLNTNTYTFPSTGTTTTW